MWPWEHIAFAYVLYSLTCRVLWQRAPTTRAALVVCFASILPDLVDKPLAWWLSVLPAGRSLGHSLVVAVPVFAIVLLVGIHRGDHQVAVAYVVGHGSHLAGDVVYPLVVKGELRVRFLLWPLTGVATEDSTQALPHLRELVAAFVQFLGTPRGQTYLVGEVALIALAIGLWVADGHPGTALLTRRATETSNE